MMKEKMDISKEPDFQRAGQLIEEAIDIMVKEKLNPRYALSGALVTLTASLILQSPDADSAKNLILDSMKAGAEVAIKIEEFDNLENTEKIIH